jgi:acetyl-CoA carboxylase biotin carboxylase subunit
MGDKVMARKTMAKAGLPVLPGCDDPIENEPDALAIAKEIGFPLIIKAAAGGGGRGMKIVERIEDLPSALELARTEATAAFGDGAMYIERYIERPRHIEFQVAADMQGNVIHFGERECSVQRRHQKLIEEAPSPALSERQRAETGETIVNALKEIGYQNVGTVEMLMDERGDLYFMEMNTRIQVEHPVTEAVTGIDLLRLQIRLAAGEALPMSQEDIKFRGHAIECRINAEDPVRFAPSPGTISAYNAPGGLGVRIDTCITQGTAILPSYDSLIAKLVVHDYDRATALRRAESALSEFIIHGIETNIPFHQKALAHADFRRGVYDTRIVERVLAD